MASNTPLIRFAAALALALAPFISGASDYELLSAGVTAQIGERRFFAEQSPDSFKEYDVRASWRTPWERPVFAEHSVGARLLGAVGVFEGSGETGAVASAIPVIALGTRDRRFTLDGGVGLALLSEHRYAHQEFEGLLQFAVTAGLEAPLYRRIGIGYRFMHYSDGSSYGPTSVGADMHMAGLTYRF